MPPTEVLLPLGSLPSAHAQSLGDIQPQLFEAVALTNLPTLHDSPNKSRQQLYCSPDISPGITKISDIHDWTGPQVLGHTPHAQE